MPKVGVSVGDPASRMPVIGDDQLAAAGLQLVSVLPRAHSPAPLVVRIPFVAHDLVLHTNSQEQRRLLTYAPQLDWLLIVDR